MNLLRIYMFLLNVADDHIFRVQLSVPRAPLEFTFNDVADSWHSINVVAMDKDLVAAFEVCKSVVLLR